MLGTDRVVVCVDERVFSGVVVIVSESVGGRSLDTVVAAASGDFVVVVVESGVAVSFPVAVAGAAVELVAPAAFNILNGSLLPPNMMLPLLEKDRSPRSSHRLSAGMGVSRGMKVVSPVFAGVVGAVGVVGVVAVAEDPNVAGMFPLLELLRKTGAPAGVVGELGSTGSLGDFSGPGTPRMAVP